MVPVERPKTNEKFASREKIRKWKTGLKVHTDRTRFGNATRIFNFQWHLTSIFFNVFQIFGTTLAILAIWSAYLVKFLFEKHRKIVNLNVIGNWKFASQGRIVPSLYGPLTCAKWDWRRHKASTSLRSRRYSCTRGGIRARESGKRPAL
jgi:hypothetical protein